jgi:hypothetical protein
MGPDFLLGGVGQFHSGRMYAKSVHAALKKLND